MNRRALVSVALATVLVWLALALATCSPATLDAQCTRANEGQNCYTNWACDQTPDSPTFGFCLRKCSTGEICPSDYTCVTDTDNNSAPLCVRNLDDGNDAGSDG
jgi:hypothetical protein